MQCLPKARQRSGQQVSVTCMSDAVQSTGQEPRVKTVFARSCISCALSDLSEGCNLWEAACILPFAGSQPRDLGSCEADMQHSAQCRCRCLHCHHTICGGAALPAVCDGALLTAFCIAEVRSCQSGAQQSAACLQPARHSKTASVLAAAVLRALIHTGGRRCQTRGRQCSQSSGSQSFA